VKNEVKSSDAVRVEVTLRIDGDWRSDPLTLLSGLRQGAQSLDQWQHKAAKAARNRGLSWDEIGAACGVSRQAAWQRFSTDRGGDDE
jgi:hypothetical protein